MVNESHRSLAEFLGKTAWAGRFAQIRGKIVTQTRGAKLAASRFAAECAIEKARRGQPLSAPETALVELATRIPALHDSLTAKGKTRLNQTLTAAMTGENTLLPVLHLLHTASLQQSRGFDVSFTGLNEATPFDLLITRENATAEVACDAISAEDGRAIHRGVWTRLIDQIDPDLQTWLAAHPGRYLLKMTLPQGLKPEPDNLPALQARIKTMLATASRADYDEAAVLRLDPLLLAGAQANDARPPGIMANLRREFGPEAHFSVTEAGSSLAGSSPAGGSLAGGSLAGGSLFVMAARGGAENQVAAAVRRRMAAIAPARLTGTRPGILAMFVDDTDQLEWKTLRDQLLLEGEARQFLTFPEARPVIAVTCASRYELAKTGAPEGDLRFRNPMHPAAKSPALAPAVLSTF